MIDEAMNFLVVDDEVPIRELIVDVIKDNYIGASVRGASDGKEALDLVRAEKPDIIITDMRMPRVNGEEFLERLEEDVYLIPTVVITGYGGRDVSLSLFRKGAFDILEKPFEPKKLHEVLKRAIQKRLFLKSLRP